MCQACVEAGYQGTVLWYPPEGTIEPSPGIPWYLVLVWKKKSRGLIEAPGHMAFCMSLTVNGGVQIGMQTPQP